jgi:hypothetical protein
MRHTLAPPETPIRRVNSIPGRRQDEKSFSSSGYDKRGRKWPQHHRHSSGIPRAGSLSLVADADRQLPRDAKANEMFFSF